MFSIMHGRDKGMIQAHDSGHPRGESDIRCENLEHDFTSQEKERTKITAFDT